MFIDSDLIFAVLDGIDFYEMSVLQIAKVGFVNYGKGLQIEGSEIMAALLGREATS